MRFCFVARWEEGGGFLYILSKDVCHNWFEYNSWSDTFLLQGPQIFSVVSIIINNVGAQTKA